MATALLCRKYAGLFKIIATTQFVNLAAHIVPRTLYKHFTSCLPGLYPAFVHADLNFFLRQENRRTALPQSWPLMNAANGHLVNRGRSKAVPILVVDDSLTILHAICALLEPEKDLEVIGRAADGQEAIEAVESLHPEFVLMDVSMPRMNGLRATKVLSRHFPETKVLLMSSEDSPYLREECLACGAAAFIYKPKFHKELLAAVRAKRQSSESNLQENDVQSREGRSGLLKFSSVAVVRAG
jgi:CheY-like chemotaxis protein